MDANDIIKMLHDIETNDEALKVRIDKACKALSIEIIPDMEYLEYYFSEISGFDIDAHETDYEYMRYCKCCTQVCALPVSKTKFSRYICDNLKMFITNEWRDGRSIKIYKTIY